MAGHKLTAPHQPLGQVLLDRADGNPQLLRHFLLGVTVDLAQDQHASALLRQFSGGATEELETPLRHDVVFEVGTLSQDIRIDKILY